jgi:hypothetical protein
MTVAILAGRRRLSFLERPQLRGTGEQMDGMYTLEIFTFQVNGEYGMNTTVWQLNGTNPTQNGFDTASDFLDAYNTTLVPLQRAYMSNTATIDFMRARKFSLPGGNYAQWNVRHSGTITTPVDSLIIAADIRIKPGGRSNRSGHFFAFGLPGTAFHGGHLQTAVRTPLEAFATALIAPLALSAGTAEIGTWSREIKPPKPPQPAFFTRATDFEVAVKATALNKRSLPLF